MPTPTETINSVIEAPDWDQRIARLRLIPHNHGTNDHPQIYAEIAKNIYVPELTPDFAITAYHEPHHHLPSRSP